MRLFSIDIIRGFAVLIMVSANAYPILIPFDYCPKFLRLLFSSAAPIFIFLSGFSLCLAHENGKKIKSLILRSFQVLFFAIFIDTFIWTISPFFTMDVLYLISFSMLLTICLIGFSDILRLSFAIAIIACISLTHNYYNFEISEIPISDIISGYIPYQALHYAFIDGWFPVTPWLGIFILGYITCNKRLILWKYSNYLLFLGSIFLLGFCFFYYFDFFRINSLREGYTEIFYPVSIPYLFYIFGLFLVITFLMNKKLSGFRIIRSMGMLSLPIYFIHTFLIKFYVPYFCQTEEKFNVLVSCAGFLTLYLLILLYQYFIYYIKNKIKNKYIAFVLGI